LSAGGEQSGQAPILQDTPLLTKPVNNVYVLQTLLPQRKTISPVQTLTSLESFLARAARTVTSEEQDVTERAEGAGVAADDFCGRRCGWVPISAVAHASKALALLAGDDKLSSSQTATSRSHCHPWSPLSWFWTIVAGHLRLSPRGTSGLRLHIMNPITHTALFRLVPSPTKVRSAFQRTYAGASSPARLLLVPLARKCPDDADPREPLGMHPLLQNQP